MPTDIANQSQMTSKSIHLLVLDASLYFSQLLTLSSVSVDFCTHGHKKAKSTVLHICLPVTFNSVRMNGQIKHLPLGFKANLHLSFLQSWTLVNSDRENLQPQPEADVRVVRPFERTTNSHKHTDMSRGLEWSCNFNSTQGWLVFTWSVGLCVSCIKCDMFLKILWDMGDNWPDDLATPQAVQCCFSYSSCCTHRNICEVNKQQI